MESSAPSAGTSAVPSAGRLGQASRSLLRSQQLGLVLVLLLLGTALTAAAAAWGREQGARWAVLQVNLQNEGARAFYARLGCTEHHRYHYLGPGGDRPQAS